MQKTRRRINLNQTLSDHEKKNLMILEIIRRKGPIARADIARLIDLNNVTVTSYVDQYLKKKLLVEAGVHISTGGRKPTLVDLDPTMSFGIGVGLNTADLQAVLCNLKGEVLYKTSIQGTKEIREDLPNMIVKVVEKIIEESNVDTTKVHGIGVGVPGIVNHNHGTVRWPFGLLNKDLSVDSSLSNLINEKFDIPVILDNDANTAVFAEQWTASNALNVKSAVYMYSGAGCGLLFDGQIYRGFTGSAGEHLFDLNKEDPLGWLRFAIESGNWWIDLGMTHRASIELEKNQGSKLAGLCNGNASEINLKKMAEAAESGDDFVVDILKQAGTALGRKTALIANLLNPELIIVGGGVEDAGIIFMDAVRAETKIASVPEATSNLRIVPSELGEDAVALGAAALVIHNFFITS